ncbi:hypothetical protein, partial [uncultured Rheinheimera sp.]|uniref:hypothetical protein n=1 Tax=uncultured Rheinheimera sp. TaxID=400532 RepID=UPI00259501A6
VQKVDRLSVPFLYPFLKPLSAKTWFTYIQSVSGAKFIEYWRAFRALFMSLSLVVPEGRSMI